MVISLVIYIKDFRLKDKINTWEVSMGNILTLLEILKNFTAGKKTYLLAFSSIIAVFVGWSDDSIPTSSMIEQVIGLLLVVTVRQGVSHEVKKATENMQLAPPAPANIDHWQKSETQLQVDDIVINFK